MRCFRARIMTVDAKALYITRCFRARIFAVGNRPLASRLDFRAHGGACLRAGKATMGTPFTIWECKLY